MTTTRTAAIEFARRRKHAEACRLSRLRAAGKLEPLPLCQRCGARCLTDRWLPLCSGCHRQPESHGRRRVIEQTAELLLEQVRSEPAAVPMEAVTQLRQQLPDRVILDWITLAHLLPSPGTISVSDLRERWSCSQSHVSRRINAVAAAGLADITPGWGAYHVHAVKRLEVGA